MWVTVVYNMATVTRKTFADKVQFNVAGLYVITKHIMIKSVDMYSQCTCSTYTDARATEHTHWLSLSQSQSLTHTDTHTPHARTYAARTHARTHAHTHTHTHTDTHTHTHFSDSHVARQSCRRAAFTGTKED